MVLGIRGGSTSVRKIILVVIGCLCVVLLLVLLIRKELLKDMVMESLRAVGPVFRGSCLPQGEIPSSNTSIGVVTFNGRSDALYQLSKPNHELYCHMHSYPLIDGTDRFLKGRANFGGLAFYSWIKVEFVCAMMEEHSHLDWLFWIDTDALFVNMQINLVQLLAGVKDSDMLIIAADAEGINAGTFFVRNSRAGRDFCKEVLNQRSKYRYEQQGLSSLYNEAVKKSGQKCEVSEKENLRHPSGVKACLDQKAPGFRVLKLCAMGSWGGLEWKRGHGFYFEGVYMNGDFVIHFPGDRSAKLGLLKWALSL